MADIVRFRPSLMADIKQEIKTFIKSKPGPHFAAFDADGTLWDSDVGEHFFQYQIDNCKLPALQGIDPWEHYFSLKKADPKAAYLWLAQINDGQMLSDVRKWAREAVEQNKPAFFQSQVELVKFLIEQEVIPIVVTASIKWAVEPAAALLGIEYPNVLGVKTTISTDERVTNIQDGHITWQDGKFKALMEKTNDVAPILGAGNTIGDLAMVASSQCVHLVVKSQKPGTKLFAEEDPVFQFAKKKGWYTHEFRVQ